MSGDEVLQYVQTFTEVGDNRRLNNGAVWTGHQATHTGQLTNLRRGTTSARVSVHKDRVERILFLFLAFFIGHKLFTDTFHHRLGYQVVRPGPDIDDFVVFLARSHQTGGKLGFNLLNFFFRTADDAGLLFRNGEVIHTNGGTGFGGEVITHVHQAVSEDNGRFQAHHAVAIVDHRRDGLFHHRTVDLLERNALGSNLPQQHTAHRGIDDVGFLFALTFGTHQGFLQPHFDACLQVHLFGIVSTGHFRHIREHHTFALSVNALARHPVQAQNHVLRRYDDRVTGSR